MQRAVLGGGHRLQGPGPPTRQLAALRGVVPQLRILLDGLHHTLFALTGVGTCHPSYQSHGLHT